MKDSQRQKVYNAEDSVFDPYREKHAVTIEEAQALVDAVCASALLQEKYPRARNAPIVKKGHGRLQGATYHMAERTIELGKFGLRKDYVLHELAHHFVRPTSEITAHGWQFAACYLDLVRVYMGRVWSDRLEAQFKSKRVKFKPPRTQTISDAERERRRLHGKKLAAARRSSAV